MKNGRKSILTVKYVTGNSLKKWKGVALSPDNERKVKPFPVDVPPTAVESDIAQKENIKPEAPVEAPSTEPTVRSFAPKFTFY